MDDYELKIPESENYFEPKPTFRWLIIGSSGYGKFYLIRFMLTDINMLAYIFDNKNTFLLCLLLMI